MKIAIEAQRIFRKEKHGMDYVALETIRELQKIDQQNESALGTDRTAVGFEKNQTRPAALHK